MAIQLAEVRSDIKLVQERIHDLGERGHDYRVLITRLDETMSTYGKTLEVHSRAIEAALKRIEELERSDLVSQTQRNMATSFLNNRLVVSLITFLSGGVAAAVISHFV